ncbi:olfactory receptor 6Y1 [Thomomys bottae]
MMMNVSNPSTPEADLEDPDLETSLGCTMKLHLNHSFPFRLPQEKKSTAEIPDTRPAQQLCRLRAIVIPIFAISSHQCKLALHHKPRKGVASLRKMPGVVPKALGVDNGTSTIHFILLGFPTRPAFQPLLFCVFLATYLLTLLENLLIILAIRSHGQLHTPMYFFLSHLSFLEMWYVTVIAPKMLADLLSQDKSISFPGCMTQLYFFVTFVCTEYILLAVMAFDRHVAICNPLRYAVIMTSQLCTGLAGGCWLCGLLTAMIKMVFIARLHYCGTPAINHYFCDISPLLNVSCEDSSQAELVDFFLALVVIAVPLCVVVTSYATILTTILKIPSAQGRQKAFSTCASHLAVVTLFYSTTLFTYARPKLMYAYNSNKVVSLLYTALVPLLNPIIYCLRNREVKVALKKTVLCGRRESREDEESRS